MKLFGLLAVALLFCARLSVDESDEIRITPQAKQYGDLRFSVEYAPRSVQRRELEIYDIVICIENGGQKLGRPGFLEVWGSGQFVCSCPVAETAIEQLPVALRGKIKARNAVLYAFEMNSQYAPGSWFVHTVFAEDGSVEMNCIVNLRDFIGTSPTTTQKAAN